MTELTCRRFVRTLLSKKLIAALLCLVFHSTAFGQAGLLTGGATDLEPIRVSVGQPLTEKPYELESGKYYSIDIISDGSGELALVGPEFFRNVWIDEVIINDLEIRPIGIDSFEFDDEGTISLSFVTIKPGKLTLRIPNTTAESQQAVFNVK